MRASLESSNNAPVKFPRNMSTTHKGTFEIAVMSISKCVFIGTAIA